MGRRRLRRFSEMKRGFQALVSGFQEGGGEDGYIADGGITAEIDSHYMVDDSEVDYLYCGVGIVTPVDGEDEICLHAGGCVEGGDTVKYRADVGIFCDICRRDCSRSCAQLEVNDTICLEVFKN